ncbi:hypothetical protein GGI35DRAFT_262586 [Trichoderma velutinum]
MSQSGARVSPQVSEEFQKLKRSNDKNRLLRYVIFKLSDDYSEIQVEHAEATDDWDDFREKLLSATSKNKAGTVGKGPRYAVYDFGFKFDGREINKIILIANHNVMQGGEGSYQGESKEGRHCRVLV